MLAMESRVPVMFTAIGTASMNPMRSLDYDSQQSSTVGLIGLWFARLGPV